jgi:hypothetical protein
MARVNGRFSGSQSIRSHSDFQASAASTVIVIIAFKCMNRVLHKHIRTVSLPIRKVVFPSACQGRRGSEITDWKNCTLKWDKGQTAPLAYSPFIVLIRIQYKTGPKHSINGHWYPGQKVHMHELDHQGRDRDWAPSQQQERVGWLLPKEGPYKDHGQTKAEWQCAPYPQIQPSLISSRWKLEASIHLLRCFPLQEPLFSPFPVATQVYAG